MLAIKRRFEYHSIYMYAAVAVVTFFGTLVVLYLATTATINSSRADLVKIASDTPVIESTDTSASEKKDKKQPASTNTTNTHSAVQTTPAAIADTPTKPKASTTKPADPAPTTTTNPAPVIIVTPPQTPVVTNPSTGTTGGSNDTSILTPVVNLLDAVL